MVCFIIKTYMHFIFCRCICITILSVSHPHSSCFSEYATVDDLLVDLRLIWSNCLAYNPTGPVRKAGEKLRDFLGNALRRLREGEETPAPAVVTPSQLIYLLCYIEIMLSAFYRLFPPCSFDLGTWDSTDLGEISL